MENLMGLAEGLQDAVEGADGALFEAAVEVFLQPAMAMAAEQAAPLCVEGMKEKYPQVAALPESLTEECAREGLDAAVGHLQDILDYCKEMIDNPIDGFRAVGTLLLRAIYAGVEAMCAYISALISGVCGCCPCCALDYQDVADAIFDGLVEPVKDMLRDKISESGFNFPFIELLPYDFNRYDEIPERRRSMPPEQMEMEDGPPPEEPPGEEEPPPEDEEPPPEEEEPPADTE